MRVVMIVTSATVIILLLLACQPLPTPPVASPSALPASPVSAEVTPTRLAIEGASSTPPPRPVIYGVVDECMGSCHIDNPLDYYDAGAAPQPADHKGRTACLECHATMTEPSLPATHLGRLDPGCVTCHK